ncbi:MAG: Gfo/Idh/MocA family oxidoreductase [Planctomycetales bacterium]|nr:Gfo/Idh/MocA family oxidoreductase [Planctomycetales bacterium]
MTKKKHQPAIPNRPLTRRRMIQKTAAAVGGFSMLPLIIPSHVLGQNAPSNRIHIGCIGVGRMGLDDLRDVLRFESVRVTAVCDVDSRRADYARRLVDDYYLERGQGGGCRTFGDFRELLAYPDIDAVQICTPDHWHGIGAVTAAQAGKDILLQKPLTLTWHEGRVISDTVRRYGVVFQVGSQQRSDKNFRHACELVRNGRIGRLHTVKIGMVSDSFIGIQPTMAVPDTLDYEMWLGPAPWAPYTEQRVHPQNGYDRPGWMRIYDYGLGMIANWGAHHLDIAQWAMGTEHTGPVEIVGRGQFSADGLWTVHEDYFVEYTYANGVKVLVGDYSHNREGVLFEGTEGWVHVQRGAIEAHPKSLLTSRIAPNEIHLYFSNDHKRNFIECIRSRRETIAPAETGHRSCTACILGEIAMRLGQPLRWDSDAERFTNCPTANRMLFRSMRSPWTLPALS